MNFGSYISKHRSAIMGVAALMIIGFHSEWKSGFFLWDFLIKECGNMGVDIFVFVSGFGIAFSLEKSMDFFDYYKRRLLRILPSYYVMMLAYLVLHIISGTLTTSWFLKSFIPVGVWVDAVEQFWYVSASLGFYLLAPFFFLMIKKARFPRVMLIALVVVTGLFIPSFANLGSRTAMRFPALVMGVGMGAFQHMHTTGRERNLDLLILLGSFAMGFLIMKDSPILKLPVLRIVKEVSARRLWKDIMTPLLVVVIAYVLDWVFRSPLRFMNTVLNRIGMYSLEAYMCHIVVRGVIRQLGFGCFYQLIGMLILFYPLALAVSWAGKKLLWMVEKLPIVRREECN